MIKKKKNLLKKCIADGGFIVVCCCLRSEDPEEEDEPNDPTLSPETHTGNMEVGPQYCVVITPGESRGGGGLSHHCYMMIKQGTGPGP